MFISRKKTTLTLSLAVLLFSSLSEARTYCDINNRPTGDCYLEGTNSVCAYYTADCPFEICGKFASNPCYACANDKVLYYEEGECNPAQVVQKCYDDICFPDEGNYYAPVCGLKKEGDQTVSHTFDNACLACKGDSYEHFQAGVCEQDRKYCGHGTKYCGKSPVCALFSTRDVPAAFTTVSGSKDACADKSVEYFTKGECKPLREDRKYCLPNSRPEFCTTEHDPVCGFYKDENGKLAHKVLPNGCEACSEKDVLYHTPGPCVFKCDLDPEIIYECSGEINPVCGTYMEDGVKKQVSLRNDCLGCYYSGKEILTWTDGLCPGDKGIRCENDGDAYEEGFEQPVCGYTKEDCNDSSCRETYDEPNAACKEAKNIWYSIGECPQ